MIFDVKNTNFSLQLSGIDIQFLVNALVQYINCEQCLNTYSSLEDLLKNEKESLELLYNLCTLIQNNSYSKTIEKVSKYYDKVQEK